MRTLLLLPLLSLVAGCGDDLTTHKGIVEAKVAAYNDLAEVFDSIKDTSTAKSAESDLQAIQKRIDEAERATMNVAGELNIEDMQELGNKLAAAERRKAEAMMKLYERIKNDPEAQAALDKALR